MRVFITGGTGFLGRGFLRRFASGVGDADWDITVYSRDEHKQVLCKERWPNVTFVLGDVTNYERLCNAMRGHDVCIHTAAVKFIPEAEMNVSECIDINVLGTKMVLEAAAVCGVHRVCAISTDKACLPLNVYGMTKALVERLVGEYARYYTDTDGTPRGPIYTSCRYGNVVGSTGSVIPLFARQVATTGRVTITDPYMTRYWISIDEAVDLVLASLVAGNGDVVIPRPAAMSIGDLARIFVHGDSDKIDVVGKRPGEKMHEQLLHQQESVRAEWDGTNFLLHPQVVDSKVYSEPFMLSSNSPHVWLQPERMSAMIDDALTV